MPRHLSRLLIPVLILCVTRSAAADLEEKIARRAIEPKAAYDKALQAAMGGKRDLKWLDYLQQEIGNGNGYSVSRNRAKN